VHPRGVFALVLAAVSTALINLAYLREQEAAADLPPLSLGRPRESIKLILSSRDWLAGFGMESTGFAMYAAALALASLALVQSVAAGGIGVLAFVCARRSHQRLGRRRVLGVTWSILGLLALGISLTGGAGRGTAGSTIAILAWLGGTAVAAVAVLAATRGRSNPAIGQAMAGGLLFSIGDFSTKVATQGGPRFAFVVTMIAGYGLGTSLLQIAYQKAGPLTVAGLATLMTNALPILAGTVVLREPVPSGFLGALRVLAFVAVTVGAVLIATPRSGGPELGQPVNQSRRAPRPPATASDALGS
jgi:drug/metabolite transporter (DMT)-like permease